MNCRNYLKLSWLLLMVMFFVGSAKAQQDENASAPTTGTLSGQVVNENGQPIPFAMITVRGALPQFQPRTTTSDSEGRFQVGSLEPVLYGISASSPAYITPPRNPDASPPYYRIGDTATITLIKGGVITGTVLTSSGDPVVQLAVRAILIKDANGQAPRYNPFPLQRTTDDRGVYRIYSLLPGTYLVNAGGRQTFGGFGSGFDDDAPTYAPSSTRDTATEVVVRSGEEITGVDIRYRGEPGHTISGQLNGPADPGWNGTGNLTLLEVSSGTPLPSAFGFQQPNQKGFAFHGVADGEYELVAQTSLGQGQVFTSEPRRISVKGADVTGIEISVKPLGSISGRVVLEHSPAPECEKKRQPLFPETLVMARRNDKASKEQARPFAYFIAQGSPNPSGDFQLRNLVAGEYDVNTRFFARYWYLRSVTAEAGASTATTRANALARKLDVARNGINLKFGEQLKDVTIRLALGAGSLRGKIMKDAGAIPSRLLVHLVPAEKENAEDVLRYFVDEVNADGSFALNNLPPGRYFVFSRAAPAADSNVGERSAEFLAQLRRAAESSKTEIEFKPCQNIANFQLPLTNPTPKN